MDLNQLQGLLTQDEYGRLEFKREWYKLDSENSETKKRERGELTKDILSLANGNIIVAGEEAYLIIGADPKIGTDGRRATYDVDPSKITPLRIRDIVNNRCSPPLEELFCDTLTIDGNRVVVITIPPTPHIYETTDVLRASETTYDKFTVLVRHTEGVVRASTKECANLLHLKQVTFRSNHGAPPVAFGATIGAIVGGAVASSFAGQKLMVAKHNWVVASIMGATVGSWVGMSSGYVYRSILEMRPGWLRTPNWGKALAISGGLSGSFAVWTFFSWLQKALRRWLQTRSNSTKPSNPL